MYKFTLAKSDSKEWKTTTWSAESQLWTKP